MFYRKLFQSYESRVGVLTFECHNWPNLVKVQLNHSLGNTLNCKIVHMAGDDKNGLPLYHQLIVREENNKRTAVHLAA